LDSLTDKLLATAGKDEGISLNYRGGGPTNRKYRRDSQIKAGLNENWLTNTVRSIFKVNDFKNKEAGLGV
jgi:hypothetical protein